ncbi:MAG: hypothetical protein Kow0059_07580 [Candidatus Sumerlaeia bacterium]
MAEHKRGLVAVQVWSADGAAPPMALPLMTARVAAGFPSPADDYLEKRLDLNEYLIKHPAATFFIRVEGESMTGAGIHSGDILIVDRALEPADKSIVIAVINGELTVKRVRKSRGRLWLTAENERFAPIEVSSDFDFQIWGVATFVIHSLQARHTGVLPPR